MHQVLSIVAAVCLLATASPETGAIVTKSPVVVSTCAVRDLYDPATLIESLPPTTLRWLELTFRNSDDVVATRVEFDVTHGYQHTTVIDRGRFSRGVAIERMFFDEFPDGGYSRAPDTCTVAAITFADGRRWTAPGYATETKIR